MERTMQGWWLSFSVCGPYRYLRIAFGTLIAVASSVGYVAAQSPAATTMVIVTDPRSETIAKFGNLIENTARDAVAQGVDVGSVDVPTLASACVAKEIANTGSTDADVLIAARKCSGAADKSGRPMHKIGFVTLLRVAVEIQKIGGTTIMAPSISLHARLQDVESGTLVAAEKLGGFPANPFPMGCNASCQASQIAHEVRLLADQMGSRLVDKVTKR
jgi:hypothetical protein